KKKLTPRLKIIIIAGLVLTVIIMAGITAMLVSGGDEKPEEPVAEVVEPELEPEPEPEPEPEIELKKLDNLLMEPFLLTFDAPQGEQFLRIGIVLQLSNKEAIAEIDQNLVIVRDAIFFFLKRKELNDFNILKRKKEMMLELKRLLDRSIQNGRVDKVMITEMTIY
ncbi:MAG: flagellar basal body-associated FliL family protein, partial [Nitrospinota bacterium]